MLKALIVDDSRSARFSLKKMLEKLSVMTEEAASGQEALLLLERLEYLPDIIFMDHYMPDIDGFEVTKRLRSKSGWSQIPIIMCTSKDGDEYKQEALQVGANEIITKPAKYEEIMMLISKTQEARPIKPQNILPIEAKAESNQIIEPKDQKIFEKAILELAEKNRLYLEDKIASKFEDFQSEILKIEEDIDNIKNKIELKYRQLSNEAMTSVKQLIHESLLLQHSNFMNHELAAMKASLEKNILLARQDIQPQILGLKNSFEQLSEKAQTENETHNEKVFLLASELIHKEIEKLQANYSYTNEKIQSVENKIRQELKLVLQNTQQKQQQNQLVVYSLVGISIVLAVIGIVVF